MTSTIIKGHVLDVLATLPDCIFHEIITSIPYYGLRNYGTPPVIWDGDPNCKHEWNESSFCIHCGAWRGELGQEPTPELYVKHITDIFRELRRVLRDDGICWLNVGDSYAGSGRGPTGHNGIGDQTKRQGFDKQDSNRGSLKYNPIGGVVPSGCKPKDLIGIPWMLAFSLRADGWYLRSDIPWLKRNCLASGTVVYTKSQKGVMPSTIHDLVRLEPGKVEVWNGTMWTKVVHMEQTEMISDGIELAFRNGEKIVCTKEHRWPTTRGLLYASDLKVGDIVSHTTLPDTHYNASDFVPDEIGYIIGLFLAEGSYLKEDINSGAVFNFAREETYLDDCIRAFAQKYEGSCHSHTYDGKLMSVLHGKIPLSIISTYISNRGSKQMRLSNACWERSNMFLENLLHGYLEGDGHFDTRNDRWRLGFCENDNLAQDIRTLCARLGASLRLNRGLISATKGGKLHRVWRGQIRFNTEGKPCNDGGFKMKDDYEITSVSKAKPQHFYDIGVADDPHLFALASGLLTHNSMPSSVKDRPGSSIEHIFLLAKSTHYFYDHIATMQPVAESSIKRIMQPNFDNQSGGDKDYGKTGVNPSQSVRKSVVNFKSRMLKQDNAGNNTYTGFNGQYEPNGFGLRYMRDSDFFFRTWQGLLHNEDGEPMALVVNPKGYKGAHFACFPVKLAEALVLAGTSEKGVCPHCGAPWVRQTRKQFIPQQDVVDPNKLAKESNKGMDESNGWGETPRGTVSFETTGWVPSCSCEDNIPIPATVLDPFNGSGATGVACQWHNRDYVGIEINPDYCTLGKKRLEENK